MPDDIQGLIDRIQSEGLRKAGEEKDKIIADARAQAAEILKQAKAEAADILRKANADAAVSENKGKAAVQQAARDIMISLKADLLARLNTVVKDCAGAAMTPEIMAKIILEMAAGYRASGNKADEIELLLQKKDAEKLTELLKGSVLKELQANPVIRVGGDFSAGLQIGFKGSDVFLDFSDEALCEIICNTVGPKLAAVIKG